MRVKSIELWRLAFSITIVLCHASVLPWNVYPEGGLRFSVSTQGVEFFFLLSGFLMAQSVSRANGKMLPQETVQLGTETFSFLIKKMKPIIPIYLFAAIFELAMHLLLRTNPPEGLAYRLWDFLFLRAAGLGYGRISAVGGGWYISAMFLSMWILYPLLRKFTDTFTFIVAPLVAVFLYGYFEIQHGHINFALHMKNGVCLGLLRAIAEMCNGVFCFGLCGQLKQHLSGKQYSWPVTAGEFLGIGTALVCTFIYKRNTTDFLILFLLSVGIICAFSGKSHTMRLLAAIPQKWISNISVLSLCLYLNHYVWINTLQNWKVAVPFWHVFYIYLILSFLTALACFFTVKYIGLLLESHKARKAACQQ